MRALTSPTTCPTHGMARLKVGKLASAEGRVVTTNLPQDIFAQIDKIATRLDRSKTWIIRQAVTEWLAEERRRHELAMEFAESGEENGLGGEQS